MLTHIAIKNFKSLADVHVALSPFTVLIGKNGAGKSAFLQAIEVLSWLVRNASINEKFEEEHVTFNELVFAKAHTRKITWDCRFTVCPRGSNELTELAYLAQIGKRRHVHITSEFARLPHDVSRPVGEIIDSGRLFMGRASRKVLWAQEGGKTMGYENVPFAHSLLRDVYHREPSGSFPILKALAQELVDFRHFQIWGPEPLREPSTGPSRQLSERGYNLPAVLADLKREAPADYKKLLKDVKEANPFLDEIEITGDVHRPRYLAFLERPTIGAKRRVKYSPAQVSDGFLRMLALTTLKYQRKQVRILGYEEPENGIHPALLRESVRHLREIAANGTQVIVTTHSPYMLDYLMEDDADTESVAKSLHVVHRDNNTGKTEILPANPKKLADARDRGISAGELWGLLVDELKLVSPKSKSKAMAKQG